jgi:hypothetical protein
MCVREQQTEEERTDILEIYEDCKGRLSEEDAALPQVPNLSVKLLFEHQLRVLFYINCSLVQSTYLLKSKCEVMTSCLYASTPSVSAA